MEGGSFSVGFHAGASPASPDRAVTAPSHSTRTDLVAVPPFELLGCPAKTSAEAESLFSGGLCADEPPSSVGKAETEALRVGIEERDAPGPNEANQSVLALTEVLGDVESSGSEGLGDSGLEASSFSSENFLSYSGEIVLRQSNIIGIGSPSVQGVFLVRYTEDLNISPIKITWKRLIKHRVKDFLQDVECWSWKSCYRVGRSMGNVQGYRVNTIALIEVQE
ncbi:hypothetical protein SO802_009365 [Lithocarpus litseifolius]|uniref:Uncharacterized protein n=1 Tax=Lithocarpus litseifolius TaxID=425828 RepID=A0AAW2DB89_9ROSI